MGKFRQQNGDGRQSAERQCCWSFGKSNPAGQTRIVCHFGMLPHKSLHALNHWQANAILTSCRSVQIQLGALGKAFHSWKEGYGKGGRPLANANCAGLRAFVRVAICHERMDGWVYSCPKSKAFAPPAHDRKKLRGALPSSKWPRAKGHPFLEGPPKEPPKRHFNRIALPSTPIQRVAIPIEGQQAKSAIHPFANSGCSLPMASASPRP